VVEFFEDDFADALIAHPEELLGEPLKFLKRKFWIGRYEIDLLFEDRHGGRLIVELQRGSLDRYHLYKVLDYYDEYKDRHPDEFVEVAVVANLISPERKARLAKRGINFREIPAEIIEKYLSAKTPTPSQSNQSIPFENQISQKPPETEIVQPEWFQKRISKFREYDQVFIKGLLENVLQDYEPNSIEDKHWDMFASLVDFLHQRKIQGVHDHLRATEVEHVYFWRFLDLDEEQLTIEVQMIVPELVPFLHLAFYSGPAAEYFRERESLLKGFVRAVKADPSFLLRICNCLRLLWSRPREGVAFGRVMGEVFLLHRIITAIVQEVSLDLFKSRNIPIGVDRDNKFITRPIKLLNYPAPWSSAHNVFQHLSLALALPYNSIVPLWKEGEILSFESMEGAFPSPENPFEVASELLLNGYGSKTYAVPHPSEVIVQAGEVKSVVFQEVPPHGIIYKVRYYNDAVSFGQVALRVTEEGDLVIDYFSTTSTLGFTRGQRSSKKREERESVVERTVKIGGGEMALVAAIARDFFVCEERERHYSVQGGPKGTRKPKGGIIIRYLPRFRTRYIGIRKHEYKSQRTEIIGHHVSGHLRRCRTASPLQLVLADQFNVPVPDGFTFVRPHDRGGHERVLYRSKSALEMIYGAETSKVSEKRE